MIRKYTNYTYNIKVIFREHKSTCNTVHDNMVLEITQFKDQSQKSSVYTEK